MKQKQDSGGVPIRHTLTGSRLFPCLLGAYVATAFSFCVRSDGRTRRREFTRAGREARLLEIVAAAPLCQRPKAENCVFMEQVPRVRTARLAIGLRRILHHPTPERQNMTYPELEISKLGFSTTGRVLARLTLPALKVVYPCTAVSTRDTYCCCCCCCETDYV